MTYTLNGTSLNSNGYNTESEESSIDSGLFQTALPGSSTSSALAIDLFGAFRTITITGTYIGSTVSDLATATTTLEGFNKNGTQTKVNYVSDRLGTIGVLVSNVKTTFKLGNTSVLEWTITLVETQ